MRLAVRCRKMSCEAQIQMGEIGKVGIRLKGIYLLSPLKYRQREIILDEIRKHN
jgi:hypothetical protein